MGLPGGAEFSLDAQMQLRSAEVKPGATACREFLRLGNLAQAEDAAVETPRLVFEARRHRELYVVESKDAHLGSGGAARHPCNDCQAAASALIVT